MARHSIMPQRTRESFQSPSTCYLLVHVFGASVGGRSLFGARGKRRVAQIVDIMCIYVYIMGHYLKKSRADALCGELYLFYKNTCPTRRTRCDTHMPCPRTHAPGTSHQSPSLLGNTQYSLF